MKYLIIVKYINHSLAEEGVQETSYKREGCDLMDILIKEQGLMEELDDQVCITVLEYNAKLEV